MHKLLLVILASISFSCACAQKSELRLVAGSGLFYFTGASATATTVLGYQHTYNPYGTGKGLCASLAINFRRISRSGFLFGLETGFELLRSKADIDLVYTNYHDSAVQYRASGSTALHNSFFNFSPYVGYRLPVKAVQADLSIGLDLAYCFRVKEVVNASDEAGNDYHFSRDLTAGNGDIRPRFQLSVAYRRYGVFGGYCFGIKNYKEGTVGGSADCTSQLTRFGITYRVGGGS